MKKTLARFITMLLTFTLLTGCGGNGSSSSGAAIPADSSTDAASPANSDSGAAPSGEPIRIGAINDITGPGSVLGNATVQGLQLAVDDVNAAGGVLGRPLELIVYDCKSDPNEGINAFKRLAEVDDVCLVLGPSLSNVGLAVAPYSTEYKLAFLGMFGDPRCMMGENLDSLNPYMFLMQPSSHQSAIISGMYMIEELGYSKPAFLIAQDHSYCSSQAQAFIDYCNANGIEIATIEYNKQGDIDMKTQLTNIKNSGADFIFNANPTQPLVVSTSQIYQLGIDLPQTGSLDFATPFNTLVSDPAMANNIYYASNLHLEADSVSGVAKDYLERYGEPANPKSFMGYDQVLLAASAIETAGGTDREALRDACEKFSGVQTMITDSFNMDPETHTPLGLEMYMYSIKNGEYVGQKWFVPKSMRA